MFIEGGNHGDEYEGQIVICDLIRELQPSQMQGRLILMPANNVHAVMAGRRTSPRSRCRMRASPGQRARVSEAWVDNVHRGKAEGGRRNVDVGATA